MPRTELHEELIAPVPAEKLPIYVRCLHCHMEPWAGASWRFVRTGDRIRGLCPGCEAAYFDPSRVIPDLPVLDEA